MTPPAAAPRTTPGVAAAPGTAPSAAAVPPPPSDPAADAPAPFATWKEGATVTARGRVAVVLWQHLVGDVPGKRAGYFDLDGDRQQVVVYWNRAPSCADLVEVTGKVLELRGPSKRANEPAGRGHSRPSKVDDSYRELQLDVGASRCVE